MIIEWKQKSPAEMTFCLFAKPHDLLKMNITRYEQEGAFLPEASACRTFRPKSGAVPHLPIRHPRNSRSLSLNPLLPSFAGIRELHQ